MSNNQAIVRKSYTTSATFTGVPSVELRKKMVADGFKFKNGHWYRHASDSVVVGESEVAKQLAA
jgi:hypothetical protein